MVHSPRLVLALLLQGPDLLLDDWQLGGVNHLGLPAAVGELQGAVPLALGLAHHSARVVVLHLRRHSVNKSATERQSVEHFPTF